jgi:hypothetical protein
MTRKQDASMPAQVAPTIKKNHPRRHAAKGLLAWSAGQRVLAVLPVLLLLWLAVAWAAQEALV